MIRNVRIINANEQKEVRLHGWHDMHVEVSGPFLGVSVLHPPLSMMNELKTVEFHDKLLYPLSHVAAPSSLKL